MVKLISKNNIWIIIIVSSLITTLIFNLPRFAWTFEENLPSTFIMSNQLLWMYLLLTFVFSFLIYTYYLQFKARMVKLYKVQWLVDLVVSILIIILFVFLQNVFTNQIASAETNSPHFTRYGLLSFILIAILAAFVTYVLNMIFSNQQNLLEYEMLKKENIQNQLSSLKNQIDPHFLFNSLNTLSGLTLGDPKIARKFIQNLSELLRSRLQTDTEDLVSLEVELSLLKKYIAILKERFDDNLVINIKITSSYYKYKLPPFALQQLVENAVKHNEISSANPLKININIENEYIVVSNPIVAKKVLLPSTKSGLFNLKKRYELIKNQTVIIEQDKDFIVRLPL